MARKLAGSNWRALRFACLGPLALIVCCATQARDDPQPMAVDATTPMLGVTIDDVSELDAIVESIRRLPRRAVVRIVFDEEQPPQYYRPAVDRIGAVADVMGEILDSYSMRKMNFERFAKRVEDYYSAFGNQIAIWEIGNEVNGEWLGPTDDVVAKVRYAYDFIRSKGGTTALTLHYNPGCWSKAEHEMFSWAEKHIPPSMKHGLDYAWLSYYDEDCPHSPDWPLTFKRLAGMFPRSKIGFGEVGNSNFRSKENSIRRYYGMKIDHPRYVGGYFWWYFRQDMVPYHLPLWRVLNRVVLDSLGNR